MHQFLVHAAQVITSLPCRLRHLSRADKKDIRTSLCMSSATTRYGSARPTSRELHGWSELTNLPEFFEGGQEDFQEKAHARAGTTNHENTASTGNSGSKPWWRRAAGAARYQKSLGMGTRGKGLFSNGGWEPQPNIASAFLGPRALRWRGELVPRRGRTPRCAFPELLDSTLLLERRRNRTLLVKSPFPRNPYSREHTSQPAVLARRWAALEFDLSVCLSGSLLILSARR